MPNVQYRLCFKCKWEGETAEKLCPRCRKATQTRRFIRATGAALVALGGFLIVVMGAITIVVVGLFQQSGRPGAPSMGARFTGTKDQMLMILGIFGFVLLFGFVSVIAGLWQLIFGRRNMILVYFILALGVVFLVGGSIAQMFLE
jgi:magnesium-transporting ATPase (P-type)